MKPERLARKARKNRDCPLAEWGPTRWASVTSGSEAVAQATDSSRPRCLAPSLTRDTTLQYYRLPDVTATVTRQHVVKKARLLVMYR
jgi:hypothetical protein